MRSRVAALGLALAALGLACFVLRPGPTGGPWLRDFESYVGGGAAWSAGANPYGTGVWAFERVIPGVVASRDELLPFVGPPFGLALWARFAELPYATAGMLWSACLALALAILVFGSLRLAGRELDALDVAAAAVLCGGFGPTISALALGQVALLGCGAVVATLLLLRSRQPAIASFGGGCAALLAALQPNLAIALVARLRDRRAFAALGGAAVAAYGLSAAVMHDAAWPMAYMHVLSEHSHAERGIAIQTTLAGVAQGFGLSVSLATGLGWCATVAVVALVARQLARGEYDAVSGTALAAAALPLAAPFGHEHDFAIELLPALICLLRAPASLRPLVIVATLAVAVDWLGLAQRPTGAVETAAMTGAAGLALATLGSRRLSGADLLPTALALAILPLAALAAVHPVPMWPDGLGPGWRAVPPLAAGGADAARVWGQEQSAAGLGTPGFLPSLLRAFSLLGCGALWYCASRILLRGGARDATAPERRLAASRLARAPR